MSLSRPVEFPLLKLPWLCIKCVIQNSDIFDIIYFATISNRTRRIVKISNYPLQKIDVAQHMTSRRIFMGKGKNWNFSHDKLEFGVPLVLKRNSEPFLTSTSLEGDSLRSCTAGDTPDALKMGIDFMIEVFGCTIRLLFFDGDKLSELSGLGITSVKQLFILDEKPVNIIDLKYLLETMKVTDSFGRWKGTDMSSGMDILRKDGLLATFYVESTSILFHVWHKRFPDSVQ